MTETVYKSEPSSMVSTRHIWILNPSKVAGVNEEPLRNLNKNGLLNSTYLQCEGMTEHILS